MASGDEDIGALSAVALIDAAPFDDGALWEYFERLSAGQLRRCWIACITDAVFEGMQTGRGLGAIVRALTVVGKKLHQVQCDAWEDTVMADRSQVWGGLGTARRRDEPPAVIAKPRIDGVVEPGEARREVAGVVIGKGVPPPAKGGLRSRAPDKWTLAIQSLRVGEHIVIPKSAGMKKATIAARLNGMKKRKELAVLLRSWETEDGAIVVHAHALAPREGA